MKLERFWVDHYKNLRNCEVDFGQGPFLTAVIGSNGSGKSNIMEAMLHAMLSIYFRRPPPFDFRFSYETKSRKIALACASGILSVKVDGEAKSLSAVGRRLREGASQTFFPDRVLVYYSGECPRLHELVDRYDRHFQKLSRAPDLDRLRPLFVATTNQQSRAILLALFAHQHGLFLERLRIKEVLEIALVLRAPDGFDSARDEPTTWGTQGAIRRILASIVDTAANQRTDTARSLDSSRAAGRGETRTFEFRDGSGGAGTIVGLAARLTREGDNLYLALEALRVRGILVAVNFRLRGREHADVFDFEQLSEGEKQLVAVVGAIRLTSQSDNLVLLDEPDTHLNPAWSWEYPSMLHEAFTDEERPKSTVLMATHDPVMISGLESTQVLLATPTETGGSSFSRPLRSPRGQGVANLLCSPEFFGLPSSLDKETQKLLDERLALSVKTPLTDVDKARLKALNDELEILEPGISERDPAEVAVLREFKDKRRT